MNNSDTPRTDDIWKGWLITQPYLEGCIEETRLLERELNEATRHIGELEEELDRLRLANLELTQTLNYRCERGIRD